MKTFEIVVTQVGSFHSLSSTETGDKAGYTEGVMKLNWIPKDSVDLEYNIHCSDLFDAISKFNELLNDTYGGYSHGGKREGSGRPRAEPKKPVRITEREERLLLLLRQYNLTEDFIEQAIFKAHDRDKHGDSR